MKLWIMILVTGALMLNVACDSSSGNDDNDAHEYTVSGALRDNSDSGVSGESVQCRSDNSTIVDNAVTGENGGYTLMGLEPGSYYVIPVVADHIVTPVMREVTVGEADLMNIDFTVMPLAGVGGGAGSHSFMTLKTGAWWYYETKSRDAGETSYTNETELDSITGTQVIDGKTYWVVMDQDDGLKYLVRVEGDIAYIYMDFAEMLAKPAIAKLAKPLAGSQLAAEVPYIDFSAGDGDSWTIFEYSMTDEGVTYTIDITGTRIGTENVVVKAGSYNGCMKYQNITIITAATALFTMQSKMTLTGWFAPGTGPVKSTEVWTENGEIVYEYEDAMVLNLMP